MAQHQAAFLDGKNKPLRVGPIDSKKPGPGEVLIQARALAINPVDWKIQDSGLFIKTFPTILGEDLAGEVLEVGEGVTNFTKGQRVLAYSLFLGPQKLELAGFQERVISAAVATAPIPDSLSYEAASVLPLAISTAAAGLFQTGFLALDYPTTSPKKNGKTVLVWGGSSSVGSAAIQLAVAAGYDVVSTASPRNFDLVKGLGAKAVFDHNSSSVVADLVAALKQGTFAGAFDAISLKDTQLASAEVVKQLGGSVVATVLPPVEGGPEGVTFKSVFALTIFGDFKEVGKAVWTDFLPEALKSGQFKSAPPAKVVGQGLDTLQTAFDTLKAGVSGTKIVVTL